MSSPWFPRPAGLADITEASPDGAVSASELLELLADAAAVEWRDKVGVAGRADGSAKTSCRLLAVRGLVAKTRVDLGDSEREPVLAWIDATREAGERAGVWHPSKQWFAIRSGDRWYPLSLSVELATLRTIASLEARFEGWAAMLGMALEVSAEQAVGLDLNPANFARESGDTALYYLDDELYPPLTSREVAGAIAARIPEEPSVDVATWSAWLRRVDQAAIEAGASLDWRALADELGRYPLAERYLEIRAALIETCAVIGAARAPRRDRRPGRLTCVLADVHANLPALLAVLEAARSLGADRYLFLGDAVGYGPHPAECVERLAELDDAVLIRGNHDHAIATGDLDTGMNRLARATAQWTLETLDPGHRSWLRALPVEHLGDGWMAVHGSPRDPQKFLAYVYELTYEDNLAHMRRQSMPLCFYGHTHVPLFHVELPAGPTKLSGVSSYNVRDSAPVLVNPGSVGQPRDGDPRAGFATWNRETGEVALHRVPYDLGRTVRDLRAAKLPGELAARLQGGL